MDGDIIWYKGGFWVYNLGCFSCQVGANEIKWANMIILEKDYMSFFPKKTFSYEWILDFLFLQLVIINVYGCPSIWHVVFFIIFKWILSFENVLIPCKFSVSFFKMIIISNHNQFLCFYIFIFSCLIK
jgi:hypothetical protein